MLILMDIGNTRSKYVTVENGQRSTINYCDNHQLDEYWLNVTFKHATGFILANVNHDKLTLLIKNWSANKKITFQLLQSKHQQFELKCAYQQPSQLGIDRWLAMLAVSALFPKKTCLVIDAGTATTIDVVSPQSEHLGGWILPGIDMIYHSLVNNTQKIVAEKTNQPSLALGKNTSECVNNAVWAITVGTIELQCKHIKAQYAELEIIMTGGNCHGIAPLLTYPYHIIDDLIFIGMQRFSH